MAGRRRGRPGRHADPDPRGVPDHRRGRRDVPHAFVCEHRDGLRREPAGGIPPRPLVDDPRPHDGAGGPPAARVVDDVRRVWAERNHRNHVLRDLRLRVRRIPGPLDSTTGAVPREVRRAPHDDQRPGHDCIRPVDRLRRMVLHHPAVRRGHPDGPRGPGAIHGLPPPEFPDLWSSSIFARIRRASSRRRSSSAS